MNSLDYVLLIRIYPGNQQTCFLIEMFNLLIRPMFNKNKSKYKCEEGSQSCGEKLRILKLEFLKSKCISLFILIFMFFLSSVLVLAAENLLTNPGFETGSLGDWFNYRDCQLLVVQYAPRSGNYCAYISNRTEDWNGVAQELVDRLKTGKYYNITAWVKLEGSNPPTSL